MRRLSVLALFVLSVIPFPALALDAAIDPVLEPLLEGQSFDARLGSRCRPASSSRSRWRRTR